MKLTSTDLTNLNNVINVCALVGIDMLLLDASSADEPAMLSGINSDRTCVIITNDNIPVLDTGSKLALKKLKLLKQRLDLFKTDPQVSVELKKKPNGDISELLIKGTKASSQYRTSPINSVQCPKSIEDTPLKTIKLTREEVTLILNAEKAMGSKKITIAVKKGTNVTVELSDGNNDLFSIPLSIAAEDISDEPQASVISYFHTDGFSPLVRAAAVENEIVSIDLYEASAKIEVSGYVLTMICPIDI